MPSCVAGGAELEPPIPRSPHRLRQEPVPHRRTGLVPPPHHQGCGGRRRHQRDQCRRRPGGDPAPGVIPAVASDAISSGRTNGFTKNVLCHRGSRQSRGRQSDAAPIRSVVLPAAAATRRGRWDDGPGAAA